VNPDSGYFLEGEDHEDPLDIVTFPEDEASMKETLCWCSACHKVFDKKSIEEWHEKSRNATCPMCRSSKGFIPYGVSKTATTEAIHRDEAKMIRLFDTLSAELQEMRKLYAAANRILDQADHADTKAATMRVRWQERKMCAPVNVLDAEARVCNNFKRCQDARTECMRYVIRYIEDARGNIDTYLSTLREGGYQNAIPPEAMKRSHERATECNAMVTFWTREATIIPSTLNIQEYRNFKNVLDNVVRSMADRTYADFIHFFAGQIGYLAGSLGTLDYVLQAKGIPSWLADRQTIEGFAETLGNNDF
jgi:hypothetical protein